MVYVVMSIIIPNSHSYVCRCLGIGTSTGSQFANIIAVSAGGEGGESDLFQYFGTTYSSPYIHFRNSRGEINLRGLVNAFTCHSLTGPIRPK